MLDHSLEHSVLDKSCPSRQVLGLIANKWTVLVIYSLSNGTKRYSQLQHAINGVSQKMLTQTLRNLERDGLVERMVYPVVPPKVEYTLTSLGETLIKTLSTLCAWAEEHIDKVEKARERYGIANDSVKSPIG